MPASFHLSSYATTNPALSRVERSYSQEALVNAFGLGWRTPLWQLVRSVKPVSLAAKPIPANRARVLKSYLGASSANLPHEEMLDTYA